MNAVDTATLTMKIRNLFILVFLWFFCSLFLVAHDCLRVKSGPDAVIRVYDSTGNVIETHEHKGDFKEP
jgi:hypothetical protein